MFSGGVLISVPQCTQETGGGVVLFEIPVIATSVVSDRVLSVHARIPPLNIAYDCPLVTLCDALAFSIVCVRGDVAILNPTTANDCDLPVRGEAKSWSQVKRLYRN